MGKSLQSNAIQLNDRIGAKIFLGYLNSRFNGHNNRDQGHIEWEREVITPLAGTGKLFAMPVRV